MRASKQSRAPLALDAIERGPGLTIPAPFTPWEWALIRAQRAIAAPRVQWKVVAARLLVGLLVLPLLAETADPAFLCPRISRATYALSARVSLWPEEAWHPTISSNV
jgi:hypothetical protein